MITMPGIFNTDLIDSFFDDYAAPSRHSQRNSSGYTGIMKADIWEYEKGFEIAIELPGYSLDNIQAELKDGYLTVKASQSSENSAKENAGKLIRRERYTGACSRSFYVGEELTQQDIKAKFTNGVLSIVIPKKEALPKVEQKKFISIEG